MAYLGKTDTMKVLANQNRQRNDRLTWQQMFAATDIAAQQATSAVDYNFAKEVSDAYDASLLAKSNVYSGDYRTGTQNEMLDEIDLALNDAYNKSIEKFLGKYSVIRYKKNNREYISPFRTRDLTPDDVVGTKYIEVPEEVINADNIYLDIILRNKKYTYTLK